MSLSIGRHYGPGGKRVLEALGVAQQEGATAIQVFAGGNRTRKVSPPSEEEAERFITQSAGMYKTIHAAYVINTAQPPDSELSQVSQDHLVAVLEWGTRLGFDSVVFHPGSAKDYPRSEAVDWCHQAVCRVMDRYQGPLRLLLENSAGDKADRVVGRDMDELVQLVEDARASCGNRLGICVDTAHAYPAGYPVAEIAAFPQRYPQIDLIHFNSCRPEITLGCRVDRHGTFSEGNFTPPELELLSRSLQGLPIILESSPVEDMEMVRQWVAGS